MSKKFTPGALRAAREIGLALLLEGFNEEEQERAASIIDKETAAPELLDAAEEIVYQLAADEFGGEPACLATLRTAIAKARGEE